MKKVIVSALFLSLILLLAACGGSEESSDGSSDTGNDSGETSEQAADDSSSDSGQAATDKLDVTATNFEFNKDEYVVPAGKEITVSLTSKEGKHGLKIEDTDVNIQGEGTATFTIDEPGEYMIHCSVPCGEGHSGMMSTLVVQ